MRVHVNPLPDMVGVSSAATRLWITKTMIKPLVGGVQEVLENEAASVPSLISGLALAPKLANAIAIRLSPCPNREFHPPQASPGSCACPEIVRDATAPASNSVRALYPR